MPFITGGAALIGGILNYSSNRRAQNQQNQQTQQAVEESRFVPYGVRSNFGRTSYLTREQAQGNEQGRIRGGYEQVRTQDGRLGYYDSSGQFFDTTPQVYNELSAAAQQGVDLNIATGNNALAQGMGRSSADPDQLTRQRFDRYLTYARSRQLQDYDKLLGSLALSGQAGAVNNNTGTNQHISSFAEGLAKADLAAYDNAFDREQAFTDQLLARGNRSFSAAGGIEGLSTQNIETGAGLGGRNVNNSAASLLGQAAQTNYNQTTRNNSSLVSGLSGAVDNFVNRGGIQRMQGVPTNTGPAMSTVLDGDTTGPGGIPYI
jgi:hypothetical protein